jgi:hypothetical protein
VEKDLGGEIDRGEDCGGREGCEGSARIWGEAAGAGILARREGGDGNAEETKEDGGRG